MDYIYRTDIQTGGETYGNRCDKISEMNLIKGGLIWIIIESSIYG